MGWGWGNTINSLAHYEMLMQIIIIIQQVENGTPELSTTGRSQNTEH